MDSCLSLFWLGRHSATEYLFCLYTALLMFPSFSVACSVTDFSLWTRMTAFKTARINDWSRIYWGIETLALKLCYNQNRERVPVTHLLKLSWRHEGRNIITFSSWITVLGDVTPCRLENRYRQTLLAWRRTNPCTQINSQYTVLLLITCKFH
jgi:hypothetical protein